MKKGAFAVLLGCAAAVACGEEMDVARSALPPQMKAPVVPAPIIDLRADVNRNGSIDLDDPTEDEGEDTWDALHGAVFLANIDDDRSACSAFSAARGGILPDAELPECNDAADDVVNGDDDALDLARFQVKPWPDAPEGAAGNLAVAGGRWVRIFRHDAASGWKSFDATQAVLTHQDLRAGATFGIEALDIVRDPSVWDGYVDLRLTVSGPEMMGGSDTVRFRVSPVMLHHHGSAAEEVHVTAIGWDRETSKFAADIQASLDLANGSAGLKTFEVDDQWIQDLYEPAYAAMPGVGGGAGSQQVMRIFLRSANVYRPFDADYPLREASALVFAEFRGKDHAGVQQYDVDHAEEMDSLNSMGNTETIPPYSLGGNSYPLGRILRGSHPDLFPDPSFSKMIDAQAVQPTVLVDTSWLAVGHVDETISFLPVQGARGWILLVPDPALARGMLQDEEARGNGSVMMFEGKSWIDDESQEEFPAEITITGLLRDAEIMFVSQLAASKIESQLEIIRRETGLSEDEIVRVPFLFEGFSGLAAAYQPGTVNLFSLDAHNVIAPDPHGPLIGGTDIFRAYTEVLLRPYGITVHWIDDWNLFHRLGGEVHCGTNARRTIPAARWWEGGR